MLKATEESWECVQLRLKAEMRSRESENGSHLKVEELGFCCLWLMTVGDGSTPSLEETNMHTRLTLLQEKSRVFMLANLLAFYSICTPDCEMAMPTFRVSIFSLILLTHVPINLETPSETCPINIANFIDTFQSSKQPNLMSILIYYSYISNLLRHSALWKDYILKVNPTHFKVPMKVDILLILNSLDAEMQ